MLAYIVFSVTFGTILAGDLPSYFPRCHVDDPNIDQCILNATEIVRPYLRKGVPELGIPSLDPLFIPEISLQQGTDAVNYKVTFTNVSIHGFNNYAFRDFGYNNKTFTFHGTGAFNSLSMTANYEVKGKILALPLEGKGTYAGTLGPSTGALNVTGGLVKRNEEEYFEPASLKATIVISSINHTFSGLFNGNEELSRATNQALNDNSEEIIKEITPAIEKVAEDIINRIMLGITKSVPYNKLLPPSR